MKSKFLQDYQNLIKNDSLKFDVQVEGKNYILNATEILILKRVIAYFDSVFGMPISEALRFFERLRLLMLNFNQKVEIATAKLFKGSRFTPEYIKWRQSVLNRDGNKCVECGSTSHLHAHHVKPFSLFHELRHELSNGQTLCKECHKKTDSYMSKIFTVYLKKLKQETVFG